MKNKNGDVLIVKQKLNDFVFEINNYKLLQNLKIHSLLLRLIFF